MKSLKDLLAEVNNRPEAEIDFINKHEIEFIDHPASEEGQHVANTYKKPRIADYDEGEDEDMYGIEGEYEDDEYDYDEDYDEDDDDYAFDFYEAADLIEFKTASGRKRKIRVENVHEVNGQVVYEMANGMMVYHAELRSKNLKESFSKGVIKLNDGSKVTLSKEDADLMNQMFSELTDSNKKKMREMFMANTDGFKEILSFAREAL